jgi:hypothetical protein
MPRVELDTLDLTDPASIDAFAARWVAAAWSTAHAAVSDRLGKRGRASDMQRRDSLRVRRGSVPPDEVSWLHLEK